jgi:hypothetical protein
MLPEALVFGLFLLCWGLVLRDIGAEYRRAVLLEAAARH